MAEKNVIRQDVVQVAWEVEAAPLAGIDKQFEKLEDSAGGAVKGMRSLGKSADKAGDAVGDVAREGKKLRGIPADDVARDFRDMGSSAGKAEKAVKGVGDERMTALIKSLDDVERKMKSLSDRAGDVSGKIKGMAAGALGAVGVGLGVKEVVDTTTEYQRASNQIQTQTGMSDKEAKAASESIRSLYADNMGESFDDIARSMAQVRSVTGASGKALEGMTHNALLLRDTFEFDVGESVRSADMLMRQFGVSGNQAYSMIAQGAQNGLDKNGNLLDSLNEYSVHFRQLGFSGEQMMNMFANASKMGVFDVDKIGDSLKEFGIRSKDASKSTFEVFESMGLDARFLTDQFAHGGEAANDAFRVVTKRLKEMRDETAQNAAGVALFGTMWEDLGPDAVLAMTNVTGKITKSTAALEKINDIQYNDIGSALSALGRTVTTEVILPLTTGLGKDFSASVNRAKQYIADFGAGLRGEAGAIMTSMGQVGLMFRAVGSVIGAVFGFAVRNANIVVPAILAIVGAMMVWKVVSTAVAAAEKVKMVVETLAAGKTIFAAGAQWLLNSAFLACPITWIVLGVVALIVVIGLLVGWVSKLIDKFTGANEGMEDFGSTMKDFGKNDFTQDFTLNAGLGGDLSGDYSKQLGEMQGQSVDMTANITDYDMPGGEITGEAASTEGLFIDKSGFNDSTEPAEYMSPKAMNLTGQAVTQAKTTQAAPVSDTGYRDLPQYAPEQSAQEYQTQTNESSWTYSPTINVEVHGTGDDATLEQKITVRVRKVLREDYESVRRKHPRLIEA